MNRQDTLDRIRSLLLEGAPWAASDVYRAGIGDDGDAELAYWGALAHARSGATRLARTLLDRIHGADDVSAEVRREALSLSGRLWKDRIDRVHGDEPVGLEAAARARADYLHAYAIDGHAYPGINAASLSLLIGDRAEALALADRLLTELGARGVHTTWDAATLGEAHLLRGEVDAARDCYARAYALAPTDAGSVASMRRQLMLLSRVVPGALEVLPSVPPAAVLAFAGHMIDHPGRARPRFPSTLEPQVASALRDRLRRFGRPIVYTSAACGSDLLFVEAALAVGAEVNVVLPFDREDFVATSIAFAGPEWVARFDRALERANRVIQATDERHLGDDVLFEHAQALVAGLATLRASQLQTTPTLLAVLDDRAPSTAHVGGTHAAVSRWSRTHGDPEVIRLDHLLDSVASGTSWTAATATTASPALPLADRPQRTLKTMLFADIAGFGRLHDAHAPLFHARFLGLVSDAIAACATPPLEANTWGDALYVVFAKPDDGAAFAVDLIERMTTIDWEAAGLSETSRIRVALHSGPVFCGFDPIIQHDNYFGTSVTKAARIEPITPPGVTYASEAFVATLAGDGPTPFVCEYIGELDLPKGYGRTRIYRLERR